MKFFGRQDIFARLSPLLEKHSASLVTCRGRRRVGKSTVIEKFAELQGLRFIKIEGRRPDKKLANCDELAAFAKQLASQTGADRSVPGSWPEAFGRLAGVLNDDEWTLVLLDEISWLGHYDEAFADDLKIAWDNVFKKHDRLILVLCGSVSSWIKDEIIDNTAYMGRRSLDIVVPELPLKECVKFWGRRAARIDVREIIDVLSVTGGIPRYLEEINPSWSAEENIRNLAFRKRSVLREDFDEMFNDVITEEAKFTASVLRKLVDGPKSGAELGKLMKLDKGSRVFSALARLEEVGFVAQDNGVNPETGDLPREKRYRIRDNYTRFYLKYIEPVKAQIDEDAFTFTSLAEFEDIDSMFGLAFETLVVNNYRDLLPELHLGTGLIQSAAPYRRRGTKGSHGRKGVQIDFLIQTRKSICIVEIKRKKEIGREVINEVDAKVNSIKRRPGISAKTALVYDGEFSPVAKADGYFDAVIPFRKLLGI